MFACMDASFKNVCTDSLGITYTAYHLRSEKQTTPYAKISNSQLSNSSPLKYSYPSQMANCLTLRLLMSYIYMTLIA